MGYLNINILAVLAAAVLAFGLGWLWYSPFLFGKQWVAAHGHTPERLEAMKQGMGRAYAVTFASQLLMAAVMAVLIRMTHIQSLVGGLKLGILLWAGFVANVGLSSHMFSGKHIKTYLLDAGYQLVYLVVMGLVLTAWR
jgi:hypothetical protein